MMTAAVHLRRGDHIAADSDRIHTAGVVTGVGIPVSGHITVSWLPRDRTAGAHCEVLPTDYAVRVTRANGTVGTDADNVIRDLAQMPMRVEYTPTTVIVTCPLCDRTAYNNDDTLITIERTNRARRDLAHTDGCLIRRATAAVADWSTST